MLAGGTAYDPDGFYLELLEGMEQMKPENLAGSPFQEAHAKVALGSARSR